MMQRATQIARANAVRGRAAPAGPGRARVLAVRASSSSSSSPPPPPASSSSSPPSAAAASTLDLLVPDAGPSPPRPRQQASSSSSAAAGATALGQQQQQQRQQQQRQQQRQPSTSDWLGRAPLPPDADPHEGGSVVDAVLMAASLAALVLLSMEMYRLFAYVAFSPSFAAWRETSMF